MIHYVKNLATPCVFQGVLLKNKAFDIYREMVYHIERL